MTKDELFKLSDVEINRLISEKVMGYTLDSHHTHWITPSGLNVFSFLPFNDMNDAWQVVLHFMNRGYSPNLLNDDDGHWALSFTGISDIPPTRITGWIDDPRLWRDEASQAICLAALSNMLDLQDM